MTEQNHRERLEALWSGRFGDEYSTRNDNPFPNREAFWNGLFDSIEVASVLEVGSNVGANLQWIARRLPGARLSGIDLNSSALEKARQRLPQAELRQGSATGLPFADANFDLVFTTGVLIHLAREILPQVMSEVVRCSRRYVLCGEYYAPARTEVPYRGHEGALFKEDYGQGYLNAFPELRLVQQGFLPRTENGWDDVTYWLFEKAR